MEREPGMTGRVLSVLLTAGLTVASVACGSEPDAAGDTGAGNEPAGTEAAPAVGSTEAEALHAIGQEPGWMVDITPGGAMRVLAQYGTDTITAPAPVPDTSSDGARVYRATAGGRTITLTVTDEGCTDVMSGKPFPMTVTLDLDGELFRGCGEQSGGT